LHANQAETYSSGGTGWQSGNTSCRRTLILQSIQNVKEHFMGRPLTIGLGTLIILLLVVAFLF
jgi:hypothetical protein